MKKVWRILLLSLLVVLAVLTCMGCGNAQHSGIPNADGAQLQDGQISVYASFYPMYDFARKIGGEKVHVVNMVPEGSEPHDWEPTAADIAGLENARVFIYNGAGLEHWAEDVLASLQNQELIAVETSAGITLMEGHDHHHEDGDAHEEDAREEGQAVYDPHVWLNPLNAKKQMEAIKNAFVQADPANRQVYEANYEKNAADLDKLDEEFKATLAGLPKREIVVAHEAFGYLCDAYGLTQVGIEGLTPDSEPDPARMAEIIDFAKAHDVGVIFFEELVSPKVAETVAKAIGAQTAVLSPIEGLSDEQRLAGDDYFAVMRQNLTALKAALQ
ncbi:MAG: metal ABC transporter substrate-binding protein [Candidatus Pelethousia sp.]|nr:metal ABC transporter substrate-binding protein [Candidatus Pelethousia sp.]